MIWRQLGQRGVFYTPAEPRGMRNRNTIEFLGIWESLYNPNFNPLEFEGGLEKRLPQGERLIKLNQIAIQQMKVLEGNQGRNLLQ